MQPVALPLTCSVCGIWRESAGSRVEVCLMRAAELNGCSLKLCTNCLFYQYPTILIPLVSYPPGFPRWWEKELGQPGCSSMEGLCFPMCISKSRQVCMLAARVFCSSPSSALRARLETWVVSEDTDWLSGEWWACGRWGGNEPNLTRQASTGHKYTHTATNTQTDKTCRKCFYSTFHLQLN